LSTRTFAREQWSARLETGFARDRAATLHVTKSPLGGPLFLPNRGIDEGDYLRSGFTLRWHPNVSAEFIGTGVGASISYLRGDGDLNFQRTELTFNTRRNLGPWTFASRFDAGVVTGNPPPQELFEIGREQYLPGYDYKEFAGDQAAVLRGIAMYRLGFWNAPIRLWRNTYLPEPSPALAVSIQSGWTGASNDAARAAISRLGPRFQSDTGSLALMTPASVVTGNARATVAAGIRLFGGGMGLMMARAVDHSAPWRFQLSLGEAF
jgi:hypothetical protein